MHNGDVYEASIKDIDKKSDIATIKINTQVSPYPIGISAKKFFIPQLTAGDMPARVDWSQKSAQE